MAGSNTKVTMASIAKEAGVSVSTVSRAISDDARLPEETKRRILDIVRAKNYRVNSAARGLSRGVSDTIVALIPFAAEYQRRPSDAFYMDIIASMLEVFTDTGYDFLISRTAPGDDWYNRFVMGKNAAGLVILGRSVDDPEIDALAATNAPFVVWGAPTSDQSYFSVGSDGRSGVADAVAHLVRLGRRRIAFIGGDRGQTETLFREQGYRQQLASEGLSVDEALIAYTDFTADQAEDATRGLLARCPDIEAFVCCSDLMAIAAMQCIQSRGLRVPEDISVIGYDDIQIAKHANPPLTTIRQDIAQGGELLAQTLLNQLKNEPARSHTMRPKLIVRASCGGKTMPES